MARLKYHPRDSLPNKTALARAEALFVELTGEARDSLAFRMTALRLALESEEPARINDVREALLAFMGSFTPSRPDVN